MRKSHISSLLTLFLSVTFLLFACTTTNADAEATAIAGEGSEQEEFPAFYSKFHQDSLFQISRISWPLKGNYIQDSTGKAVEQGHLQENWIMHRPIVTSNDFVQEIEPLTEDLIIEQIKARAGKYKIERRFARLSGGWHLIYYNVTGI